VRFISSIYQIVLSNITKSLHCVEGNYITSRKYIPRGEDFCPQSKVNYHGTTLWWIRFDDAWMVFIYMFFIFFIGYSNSHFY